MENQNTLLWVVSIVAVVGIVAMVIAATRTGSSATYSAIPTSSAADSPVANMGGQAAFAPHSGCSMNSDGTAWSPLVIKGYTVGWSYNYVCDDGSSYSCSFIYNGQSLGCS